MIKKFRLPLFLRRIQWFIQRGRRGWADSDTWNLDSYLFGILAEALPHLAQNGHGHPCLEGDPPNSCKDCRCSFVFRDALYEGASVFRRLREDDYRGETWDKDWERDYNKAMDWLKQWCEYLWD